MIVHSVAFNIFIPVVIVIAALTTGIETDNPEFGVWINPINAFALVVFIFELGRGVK